ncbi:MAG: manganese-dependent inorganic pyrophosphatase [Lactobacillaceae bacterium]|jgi:manganese-dependent inorganic pyrophosphatase|nr:manganese-dependent inorganic pyrophosphatase [Lactobacillaceae bacterium]
MTKKLVFGHQNPDTDTIASAIAAAYLLNKAYGDDTEAVALGTPNDETNFALAKFGVAAPRVIETADTEQVYLVDHNEAGQSVANIADVEVVGVYDHHKISFESAAPIWFINKPLGSVATILYYEYKNSNVEIPAEIAGLLASAIISDTLLLKSPTTTPLDRPALEALATIAGLDDYKAYGLELLKAGTDLSARTATELINGDAKSFDMNGHTVRIGQVNTVDVDEVFARRAEIQAAIEAEGFETFIFVVTDILESNSDILVVGANADKVEAAFNVTLTDGRASLPGVVSRKKQVVPPLTAAF